MTFVFDRDSASDCHAIVEASKITMGRPAHLSGVLGDQCDVISVMVSTAAPVRGTDASASIDHPDTKVVRDMGVLELWMSEDQFTQLISKRSSRCTLHYLHPSPDSIARDSSGFLPEPPMCKFREVLSQRANYNMRQLERAFEDIRDRLEHMLSKPRITKRDAESAWELWYTLKPLECLNQLKGELSEILEQP